MCELCKCLKKVYLAEKKYTTAEWFFKFDIEFAKRCGWLYQDAVCCVEYVKFLKKRQRFSEALEKCQILHSKMNEDFGDDCMEWLPDVADIPALCKELESHTKSRMDGIASASVGMHK